MQPTSFRLRTDVIQKLEAIANAEDRSKSNMVQRLIEAEYERKSAKDHDEGRTRRVIGPDRHRYIGNEPEDGE